MNSHTFSVEVLDELTRRPMSGLRVVLYFYGVSIDATTGVITGTLAVPTSGELEGTVYATDTGGGFYRFTNIPSGWYSVVVSGPNIQAQILKGWEKFNPAPIPSGSEIPYKTGETKSVATVLEELQAQSPELLEARVDAVEQSTQSLEQSTQSLEQSTQSLEQSTQSLEQSTQSLEQSTQSLEQSTQSLEARTTVVEQSTTSLDQELDSLTDEVHALPLANVFDPATADSGDLLGVELVGEEKVIVTKSVSQWTNYGKNLIAYVLQTGTNNPGFTPKVNTLGVALSTPSCVREDVGIYLINFADVVIDGTSAEKAIAIPQVVLNASTGAIKGTFAVNIPASVSNAYGFGFYFYTYDVAGNLADNIISDGLVFEIRILD